MNRSHLQTTIPWYFPPNFKAWRKRLLAPRAVVLLLIITALAIAELRFDWMESALGNYLVTTNPQRPKSGAIWDQGREADQARQTLAQYSSQRQNSQIEVRRSTSLGQVVASIVDEKGAMISAEHFVELYLKLPPAISHEMISPYTLLDKLSEGRWQRTFFELRNQQLLVYLLDAQNQVIHRLDVGQVLLGYIERGEVSVGTSLDRMADFAAHLYPAERFFKVLNALSAEVRGRIVARPEDLLRVSGRIRRVGISDSPLADTVDLGFEVEDLDGPKVILMQGRYEDVRRLQHALEGRSVSGWSRPGEAP